MIHHPEQPTTRMDDERALIQAARRGADELEKLRQPLPEKIDRFEVVRLLGQGGSGAVYQARDATLNRFVAIKQPLASACATETQRSRIRREATLAAQLDHDHIVRVYEVIENSGVPLIVSEYVEGATLKDLLRGEHDQIVRELLLLMAQIARAIDFAHQSDVVHRDLKPGNVLVDAAGKPRVTDFGLAQGPEWDATLTREGQLLGTPSYMSPEQCLGGPVDARTDIYSMGVVLYEIVVGQLPFTTAGVEVFQQIQHEQPPRPSQVAPDVPRPLEAIILKCLEKSAEHRYRTAAQLADDLTAYLEGEPVSADAGPLRRRVAAVFRDTPHIGVLATVAPLLIIESGMLLISGLIAALMLHVYQIAERSSYFLLWAVTIGTFALIGPSYLRRRHPPTFIERQFFPIWTCVPFGWWSVLLIEYAVDLPVHSLAPLLPLIWALLWMISARLLSGKLYLQAGVYGLCSLAMVLLPDIKMFIFAVVASTVSLATGLAYLKPTRV